MAYSRDPSSMMEDYMNLRTLPAAIGIAFTVMSLYMFGAVDGLTIGWGIDYTLTSNHALWGSLAAYALAFASSETRSFENYERWEQITIAGGPAVMVASQHWTWFADQMAANSPHLAIVAFFVSFASYGVLVQ